MPNYLNTFSGGTYGISQPQGIGQLLPQPQGQANQPQMPQTASQLGSAVGLRPNQQVMGQFGQQPAAQQQNAQQAMPQMGAPSTGYMQPPMKTPVLGLPAMARGGVVPSGDKDAIVKHAIAAVQGRHPNARQAISNFEGVMGPDATNDLIRAHATGGQIRGSGGGVDDLVPGSIDGREDVRLASGEYVIPARVVSALGDGDTERGSQILDEFVARVRAVAAQRMAGSDPINAETLLPEV